MASIPLSFIKTTYNKIFWGNGSNLGNQDIEFSCEEGRRKTQEKDLKASIDECRARGLDHCFDAGNAVFNPKLLCYGVESLFYDDKACATLRKEVLKTFKALYHLQNSQLEAHVKACGVGFLPFGVVPDHPHRHPMNTLLPRVYWLGRVVKELDPSFVPMSHYYVLDYISREGEKDLHSNAQWNGEAFWNALRKRDVNGVRKELSTLPRCRKGLSYDENLNGRKYGKVKIHRSREGFESIPRKNGDSALFYAVKRGIEEAVGLLIDAGESVNFRDANTGQTPLHLAMAQGDLRLCKKLLESGARLDSPNLQGETPLSYALKYYEDKDTYKGRKEIAEYLTSLATLEGFMDQGKHCLVAALLQLPHPETGKPPIHQAVDTNNTALIQKLVKAGGKRDNPVLAYAAEYYSRPSHHASRRKVASRLCKPDLLAHFLEMGELDSVRALISLQGLGHRRQVKGHPDKSRRSDKRLVPTDIRKDLVKFFEDRPNWWRYDSGDPLDGVQLTQRSRIAGQLKRHFGSLAVGTSYMGHMEPQAAQVHWVQTWTTIKAG